MPAKKPVKVWDFERSKKYAFMATSIDDLKKKGKQKLGYNDDVRVVLEEDGTEVDDKEYFQYLPNNTIFILLRPHEQWCAPGITPDTTDGGEEEDGCEEADCASARGHSHHHRSLPELAKSIRKDIANIQTFSFEEKKVIIAEDPAELARLIQRSEVETRNLQMSWQETLDLMLLKDEAAELIKFYKECDSPSRKRKKSN